MHVLIDNCLSPLVAGVLRESGIRATHVRDVGLRDASDVDILAFARAGGMVVITADTDFGTELATTEATHPSVVRLVSQTLSRPELQAARLLNVLPLLASDLAAGLLATVTSYDVQTRRLPITR